MKTLKKIGLLLLVTISITTYAQPQAEKNVAAIVELAKAKHVKYTLKIDKDYGYKCYYIDKKKVKLETSDNVISIVIGRKKVNIKYASIKNHSETDDEGNMSYYASYLNVLGDHL